MIKQAYTLFLLAISVSLFGQNHGDALRYSRHGIGGTARSVAMGGAFGALGGDFSTLSANPAGLGVYRKSEFTFTPELYYGHTSSRYFGETNDQGKFNFNFSNLGYVASFNTSGGVLKSFNIGVGFNRLANYHRSYTIEGVNMNSSLAEQYADLANEGGNIFQGYQAFTSGLFYDAAVLYGDDLGYFLNNGDEGYFDINDEFIPTRQRKTVTESGRLSERTFSAGFNFNDIVYVGATFGWHKVIRDEESTWNEQEEPLTAGGDYLEYFDFNENLKVRGNGYTAKFGAMFTPMKELRFGAAIHLPVYYSMKEEYTTNISSRYIGWETYYPLDENERELDYFESSYSVTSPAKFVGSVASILGGFFILSADVEYLDYSTMKMGPSNDYDDVNREIELVYRDVVNVKVGSELRVNQTYFRGGVGFYGSPYAVSEENNDAWRLSYSAGIGYRDEGFFIDLAYQYSNYDERQVMYVVDNSAVYDAPAANIDTKAFRLMTTIGFRF